jgi:TP901 family phage tail tape measure protein
VSNFIRNMRRARRSLRRFTRSIGKFARILKRVSIAVTAFGVAAAFAFQRAARAGEMFNRKMNRSLAIMSGVSDSVRKTMERTALEVASTTIHSAEEAAESYFFLASAGLSVKQSIAALPTVAKFAQAGMFDMARATDLLTDAQSALGLSVDDAQRNMKNMKRVGNVLVKANILANASVEEFSEALTNKAGAALKRLGKDVEEGVAALTAFADQGIKGSDGGTALQIVLRELTTKAIENKQAFIAHGIAVFDSAGEMRNLAMITLDLEQSLKGMSDELAKITLMQLGFTNKSIAAMEALLGSARKMDAHEFALRRVGDTMGRVAAKQLTPFEKSLAKLQAAWVALSNVLKPAVEIVASLMDMMATKLKGIADALEPNTIVTWAEDSLNAIGRLAEGFSGLSSKARSAAFAITDFLLKKAPGLTFGVVTPLAKAVGMGDTMGKAGLGTRVRQAMGATRRLREMELTREKLRGIMDNFLGFFNRLNFEFRRWVSRGKTRTRGGGGDGAIESFIPGELRQISPSRFFIAGLAAMQAREQRVRDPQLREVINHLQFIRDNARDGTARFG